MFHFKQFSVDQSGCAMKINTDGVLLGAIAGVGQPDKILDIGTGTGVIALMLAQRFTDAKIDAVEIDEDAAQTALTNFKRSPFSERLMGYSIGFKNYFDQFPDKKYELIVSNPPFYLHSLQSQGIKKNLAKHTDKHFFNQLLKSVSIHLTSHGILWLILPPETAAVVKASALMYNLHLQKTIAIHSFKTDKAHREILSFGLNPKQQVVEQFVIYDDPKVYSKAYQEVLKNFLTIF
jgi:tRNA1Val (adenine37-N6)-methyltransferase